MSNIETWLLNQKGLNLTAYTDATLSDNYIAFLDPYEPPKNQVLAYLDGYGPKPRQKVKFTVHAGGKASPEVVEYVLPLPLGSGKYTKLRTSAWNSRVVQNPEYDAYYEFVAKKVTVPLAAELQALFKIAFRTQPDDTGNT